jgi:excisionase family DNA binding protein
MNSGARIARPPSAIIDERVSVRVVRVCAILDCEPTQVYRLIADGNLEAHRIGKRGVRVYMDSIATYRDRGQITPKVKRAEPRKSRQHVAAVSNTAHLAAVAKLRELKLI